VRTGNIIHALKKSVHKSKIQKTGGRSVAKQILPIGMKNSIISNP